MEVARYGPYLWLTDCDGRRHLIRIASIQMLSDGDVSRDDAILVVSGRIVQVPASLNKILALLEPQAPTPEGAARYSRA